MLALCKCGIYEGCVSVYVGVYQCLTYDKSYNNICAGGCSCLNLAGKVIVCLVMLKCLLLKLIWYYYNLYDIIRKIWCCRESVYTAVLEKQVQVVLSAFVCKIPKPNKKIIHLQTLEKYKNTFITLN